jgi:hypothetical protein
VGDQSGVIHLWDLKTDHNEQLVSSYVDNVSILPKEFTVLAKMVVVVIHIVAYSGCSISRWNFIALKVQYTTVNYSQQLSEHTYTSDLYGLGTLTPIELFQQDLLWQSSNTHSHSCSHKVSKYTSGQSIVGLSVHLHTTTAPRRIHH